MELSQLRCFLAVASCGSFTRAARELRLSQPALSRAIAKLEAEFGQPLLDRKPRSVVPTDAGSLLRARAIEALSILENTKVEITDDGQTGTLRIAAIPTIAPYYLPCLLREFRTAYPRACVQIYEDVTEPSIKRCEEGVVDLALVTLPVAAKYLDIKELFEEELFLVLPAGHALTKKPQISIQDVKAEPFVLLDEIHCLSEQISSYCRQRAIQPVAMERTSQLATILELVSLDHGVSMIPAMARHIDSSEGRAYRSLRIPKPTRKVAMVWNPYRFQSQLLENFKAMLVASAKKR